jgi:hypothetical protein
MVQLVKVMEVVVEKVTVLMIQNQVAVEVAAQAATAIQAIENPVITK